MTVRSVIAYIKRGLCSIRSAGAEKRQIPRKYPRGEIVYMNKEEFLRTIIHNAPNMLERVPQKDCFQRG